MHQKFGHITCDTYRAQNNPGHSEKTSNPWLPHIDLLIDLWHSVLWACCCLGTNLHRSHTHTSNLNSAGLAVFSGNSNHTNSLYVMLHMLSSWGVWHLSTGWSVATNTGVFTWASRQRFVTSADSMPDLKWSAAALITGNDSPASGQRTRMSPYAGYLTAQIG